jgi:hypothetical protein
MSISKKNIFSLQKIPYFSDFLINQIVKHQGQTIDDKFVRKVNSYLKKNLSEEVLDLDFNSHTNFIVFGFYDVKLIEYIVNKMSPLSTLTIFEKDIQLILYVFGTKDVSHILSDPRVVLIAGEKEEIRNPIKVRVAIREFSYNLPRIKILAADYMRHFNQKYIDEVSHYLISQTNHITNSLGNDINDMLEGFDNTIKNWPHLLRGVGVNGFKDKYKGIPAIIVSAGPSLDKNIEHLKKAYGKALIFAVDATLKKVLDLGVIPDAVSTIERLSNMYSIFYEDVDIPNEVVFLGPSVVQKEILDDFYRFIFTGRRGEPTVRAVADIFEYESLEIGMSCAHIPFAFANYIGADPVVFIGQDLAFSKEGHTHFAEASAVAKEGAKKQELIEVEGNDGGKLLTNKNYYNFLLWFQNQIAAMPDRTIINATEGGAKIEGTQLMRFEDVINKYCHKKVQPLHEVYDQVLLKNEQMDREEKIGKMIDFLGQLITNCELIEEEVSRRREILLNLNGLLNENVDHFYQIRKEIDGVLNCHYVLTFLFQTISLKYNRSFNNYAPELDDKDWNKLKYEGIRYCEILQQVSRALKLRFEQYLNYIKQISNEIV